MLGFKTEKLTVVGRHPAKGRARWMCKCSCGKNVTVDGKSLRNGQKSCGCIRKETKPRYKHGLSTSPEYKAWAGMRSRCRNENDAAFANYGGRGIEVCQRWSAFENFFEDMGRRPDGLSIERVDNNQGYSKENCKWATPFEQSNNKRTNQKLTIHGVTKTVGQWAALNGINRRLISERIKQGYAPEIAIIPKRVSRNGQIRGNLKRR